MILGTDIDEIFQWPNGRAEREAKKGLLPYKVLPNGEIRFDREAVLATVKTIQIGNKMETVKVMKGFCKCKCSWCANVAPALTWLQAHGPENHYAAINQALDHQEIIETDAAMYREKCEEIAALQKRVKGFAADVAKLRALCAEVRARLGRANFEHAMTLMLDCQCDLCTSKRLLDSAAGRGEGCNCDMRTKLVGDGCAVCNPALAEEMRKEEPK